MPARTRFVILAAPRTGSNLLCTLLNSHPDILCHHELFNPQGIFYALDYRGGALDLGNTEARDRDPADFLQRVWDNPDGASCVGFKMTRGQHGAVMRSMVDDRGIQKIVLSRRNRVKTYVSELMARSTNQWEVYNEEALVADRPRLRVDAEALVAHCNMNRAFYRELRHALQNGRQPWLEIQYEDIFSESEHRRMLEFLGTDATDTSLSHASVKQNERDLRAVIGNFRELESALEGNELLAELQDRET